MKRLFSLTGWIFALAFLSVGLRNFEAGLSMDGPLYATIARNLAHGPHSSFFLLQTSIPEFQPFFAEHPHLGFWTLAAFLKFLPDADWVARMPSHLFYVLSLLLGYVWISDLARSRRAGALFVVLIWAFPILSNFFSNAYLDPQAFFLGFVAVYALERATRLKARRAWGLVAGLALAGCALTKGLTVLGFGPAMAYLVVTRLRQNPKDVLFASLSTLALAFGVLGLYAWGISQSDVPAFIATYLERQWSARFAIATDWTLLYKFHYYKELARETHYLIVLVPLALYFKNKRIPSGDARLLPVILLASFVLMYFPTARVGHQYWIMLLPWAAWLIALGLDALLPPSWTEPRLRRFTLTVSVTLVVFLQYIPFKVYKSRVPELAPQIALTSAQATSPTSQMWIEDTDHKDKFIRSSLWAWYGGYRVGYASRKDILAGTMTLPAGDIFVVEHLPRGSERDKWIATLAERGLQLRGEAERSVYWEQLR